MLTNLASQKHSKSFSTSFQRVLFCIMTFITSHNALAQSQFYPVAQPQISYAMTKGDVQFLEAPAEPMYPTRALSRGIVGWAEVSFDVDTNGQVIAGSVEVINAAPSGMFDSATIRTAEKFRFAPYAPNGTPQIATGVQYRFQYSL